MKKELNVTTEHELGNGADKLKEAANMIAELQDLVIWMTGCGYDFSQHEYFCKKRDELLK